MPFGSDYANSHRRGLHIEGVSKGSVLVNGVGPRFFNVESKVNGVGPRFFQFESK